MGLAAAADPGLDLEAGTIRLDQQLALRRVRRIDSPELADARRERRAQDLIEAGLKSDRHRGTAGLLDLLLALHVVYNRSILSKRVLGAGF